MTDTEKIYSLISDLKSDIKEDLYEVKMKVAVIESQTSGLEELKQDHIRVKNKVEDLDAQFLLCRGNCKEQRDRFQENEKKTNETHKYVKSMRKFIFSAAVSIVVGAIFAIARILQSGGVQ